MRSTYLVIFVVNFIQIIVPLQGFSVQDLNLVDKEIRNEDDDKWEWGEVITSDFGRGRNKRQVDETEISTRRDIVITCGTQRVEIQLESVPPPPVTIRVRDGDQYEENDITDEEDAPCHWTGLVNGGGKATLSTCLYTEGYTGMVMTSDGVWLIQPQSPENELASRNKRRRNSRRKRRKNGTGIPHLILPPSTSSLELERFSHYSDIARVPLEELEKAARLAAQEAVETEAETPLTAEYSGPLANTRGTWNGVELLARRSRSQSTKDSKKWVEMAVFTDESMYERMSEKFPNDTLSKLKDYATTLINTMDLLYGDKSLKMSLGFKLVHLEVMKKSPSALNTNEGQAKAYLSSFCDYAGDQNVKGGKWDHALLITGTDLHEQGLKSTAGLAWAGTMCYRYYSCSLAEGTSFGSAFIITHEIGHSLGMEHDGVGVSKSCDKDKYIMSPTTGPGKVNWSNCSGKNLEDFMEYGTSELRAKKYPEGTLNAKPTCLSQLVAKNNLSKPQKLPGEIYDAYFQCALGLGNQFKPFFQRNKSPFNNICHILYCGNGTHAVSTNPSLEGTKCDKEKYCRGGKCILRPTVKPSS